MSEFYIGHSALQGLSQDFRKQADELGEELAKFKPKTDSEAIHDGFGFLTESEEVTQAYIQLAENMTKSVEGLERHLHDISDKLKQNAANTERADETMKGIFDGEGK